MINRLSITSELGDNATLLTKTDCYLELQRIKLAQELGQKVAELKIIQSAQRIKRELQQENQVAVRVTEFQNNRPVDEVIHIVALPDALKLLEKTDDLHKKQIHTWMLDGYDIEASSALR